MHEPEVPAISSPTTRSLARHQIRATRQLESWWRSRAEKKRNGYLCMPTGSGKTYTAVSFLVHQIAKKSDAPRVLWVAHSAILLDQAKETMEAELRAAGLHEKIFVDKIGNAGRDEGAHLNLMTIQALAKNETFLRIGAKDFDIVVFDEFHRLAADTWKKVPARFQRARVRTLGLSATPFRSSVKGTKALRKLLPHRIFAVGYTELVRAGFLADPILLRVKVKAEGGGVPLTDSELRHLRQFHVLPQTALDKIAHQTGRDALIVATYKADPGKYQGTIVFCTSKDHAEDLAEQFTKAGVPAESICGSAAAPENRARLGRFKSGVTKVVTSVILLTEGVDAPRCRSVFLARPTESPVLLTQMIGRAMRGPAAGGASTCYIVDFVDTLANGMDLSAGHFAFLRDSDERLRPLLRRKPAPTARGVSLSLLLRVREFLRERMMLDNGSLAPADILITEVSGWLEFWDGQMHRVLLLPREKGEAVVQAIEETRKVVRQLADGNEDGAAQEAARAAYEEFDLGDTGDDSEVLRVPVVSEEDFVAVAAAASMPNASTPPAFHALSGPNAIAKDNNARIDATRAVQDLENDLSAAAVRDEFADTIAAMYAALRGYRPAPA